MEKDIKAIRDLLMGIFIMLAAILIDGIWTRINIVIDDYTVQVNAYDYRDIKFTGAEEEI